MNKHGGRCKLSTAPAVGGLPSASFEHSQDARQTDDSQHLQERGNERRIARCNRERKVLR